MEIFRSCQLFPELLSSTKIGGSQKEAQGIGNLSQDDKKLFSRKEFLGEFFALENFSIFAQDDALPLLSRRI